LTAGDRIVVAITGNGLKTLEALSLADLSSIEPKLADFEKLLEARKRLIAA
jgi:hypothetical protein